MALSSFWCLPVIQRIIYPINDKSASIFLLCFHINGTFFLLPWEYFISSNTPLQPYSSVLMLAYLLGHISFLVFTYYNFILMSNFTIQILNLQLTTTQLNITKVWFDTKMTLHHHHRKLNVGYISAVTDPILMKL